MKETIGFIIPTYPGEKRVALLPNDIVDFANSIVVEQGFGQSMDISDEEYINKGAKVASRDQIFAQCDVIFSLKLLQKEDYHRLREGQTIIGWTHPYGSGRPFYEQECIPRGIKIIDLDNITPRLFYRDKYIDLTLIPRNFVQRNSVIAGFSSTYHAVMANGMIPTSETKVAILSTGNVAQGAFRAISMFNPNITMYYRKTMDEFYRHIADFDIIINGIQVDKKDHNIISKEQLKLIKKDALIIDAAAHQGRAIYGTKFTYLDQPIARTEGVKYYCLSNSPSLFYQTASREISKAFSRYIYRPSLKNIFAYLDKIKTEGKKYE